MEKPEANNSTDVQLTDGDLDAVAKLKKASEKISGELAKVIVGQDKVVEQLLVAIFSHGHCLLEGVPGLAKTLMVSTLAEVFDMSFSRIQFTPDLMPSDITGTEMIQEDKTTGERAFKFLRGPVFANVILADEINRTPPKTQAAMLEAMQEKQITVGGKRMALPAPFFVLATQNPIEQEGTYPLPEAQQDRFMFKIYVSYPSYDEEYAIAETTTAMFDPQINAVLSCDEVIQLQEIVRRIPVAPHVVNYALRLVRATRVQQRGVPEFVRDWVSWGAGPRAVQFLLLGGKAMAAINGRPYVSVDDIRAVIHPVMRHRIITNFNAESEGVSSDDIVDQLLKTIGEDDGKDKLGSDVARAFK